MNTSHPYFSASACETSVRAACTAETNALVAMQAQGWATVDVPFSHFQPIFRAKLQPDAPPFNPAAVSSLQIMFSKFEHNGQLNPTFAAGAFQLPILSVRTYLEQPCKPRVVCINAAHHDAACSADQASALRNAGIPFCTLRLKDSSAHDEQEAASGADSVQVRLSISRPHGPKSSEFPP
jgi:Complex I intermediate-associated protein 30 (CIA30)